MSFRDTLRTVVNYEGIDGMGEGVEFDSQDPAAMDQIEAMEAEVELVQAENDLENDIKGMEDGDNMDDRAETEIAAAEEVVTEADAKAAETGEAPAIPVEDVVASQEALKTLVERFGVPYEGTFASREDLYSNSYAAYTANLEGLREIGKKIKEGLKKIWEKIVAGFNWIVEQIKKVLPTKLNRIKWLRDKVQEYSVGKIDPAKVTKAQEAFVKDYGEKFGAVAAIVGPNFEFLARYAEGLITNFKVLDQGLAIGKKIATARSEEEAKKITMNFANTVKTMKTMNGVVDANTFEILKKNLKENLSGVEYTDEDLVFVSGRGTTLKATFSYVVKEDDTPVTYTANAVTTIPNLSRVIFSKEKALAALNIIHQKAADIAKAADALNKSIKDMAKEVGEAEGKGIFTKYLETRKAEKAIRKPIAGVMSVIGGFDSSVLGYALSYGKATVAALKDAKKD